MSEFDTHDGTPPTGPRIPVEADEADAYEQDLEILAEADDDLTTVPDDVDPADAYEQHREIGGDEDDYDER